MATISEIFFYFYVKPLTQPQLNPNQTEGGPNGPPGFKSLISQEPKVGLTSNQAVNLSLSVV